MLLRKCAGGIVFHKDSVLLLQNDKGEWVLPKGLIRDGKSLEETAIQRVRMEAGAQAEVVNKAGATSYEFYSSSRKQPVCNEITWFIMQAGSGDVLISREEGFYDGGFFPIDEAIEKITYSQDKSLLRMAADKYREWTRIH